MPSISRPVRRKPETISDEQLRIILIHKLLDNHTLSIHTIKFYADQLFDYIKSGKY